MFSVLRSYKLNLELSNEPTQRVITGRKICWIDWLRTL